MQKNIILPVILALSFLSINISAQPDTLWTRTYGIDSTDCRGNSIQQTSDRGFIIAGNIHSVAGVRDVYLIRTNSNGDTLWTRTYGGSGLDQGSSIQLTSDDGFIIAGTTRTVGNDIYLIRTDSIGDTLWTKTYGGDSLDISSEVQQTSDGGFIIAGKTKSFGADSGDVYLIRTNSNGDTLWTRIFGSKNIEEFGASVQQTNDDGFVIAGTICYSAYRTYIIRTDTNGDTLWTKTHGLSPKNVWGNSVQQTKNGGFIVVGMTNYNSVDGNNVYLIRTDSIGDSLWTRTYGGTGYEQGYSIQQTSDGGYIITGGTNSFGSGATDVYLIRTDSNGDTLWTMTYGGTENDDGRSVQQTSDGGYIITGSTSSFGSGNTEVYLIRLEPEVGIKDDNPFNFLHPNDFIVSYNNNLISIRYTLPYSSSVKLEAYDIKGKLVKVITDKFMQKGYYSVNWDSKRFGSGVYYIKLSTDNNTLIKKAIIVK